MTTTDPETSKRYIDTAIALLLGFRPHKDEDFSLWWWSIPEDSPWDEPFHSCDVPPFFTDDLMEAMIAGSMLGNINIKTDGFIPIVVVQFRVSNRVFSYSIEKDFYGSESEIALKLCTAIVFIMREDILKILEEINWPEFTKWIQNFRG